MGKAVSRKRHKFDAEATAKAGFQDKRSYWTIHGKVYLLGKDMACQRLTVFDRDGQRCQKCGMRIYWEDFHLHHVIHRGRGGDDSLRNLRSLCFSCHRKEHR